MDAVFTGDRKAGHHASRRPGSQKAGLRQAQIPVDRRPDPKALLRPMVWLDRCLNRPAAQKARAMREG